MQADTILEAFRRILGEIKPDRDFGPIHADTKVGDLGVDSITLVEALGAIEDEFGVTIPDTSFSRIGKVGDIVELVQGRAVTS